MLRQTASMLLLATSFAPLVYPKVNTSQVRGNAVEAFFADPNPGCIFTSAYLLASEDTTHIPGNPKAFSGSLNVVLSRFNVCTGQQVLNASTVEPLTASGYQVSPNLSTATLNVNTTVMDSVTGNSFDVAIALVWTATEGVSSTHSTSRSRFPGIATHFRFNGTTRTGEARGTIAALGTNFAFPLVLLADISKTTSGSVTITH